MKYRCQGIYRSKTCNRLLFIGDNLKGKIDIKCDRCKSHTLIVDGKTSQYTQKVV